MRALAFAVCLASPAVADEVWTTTAGGAIYEADIDTVAVISVPGAAAFADDPELAGERLTTYFPFLAGNVSARTVDDGYWIAPAGDDFACTATLRGPDGAESALWGRARLVWDERAFPSSWTMLLGFCLQEPAVGLRGEAFP